jgi:hypothetical protein
MIDPPMATVWFSVCFSPVLLPEHEKNTTEAIRMRIKILIFINIID